MNIVKQEGDSDCGAACLAMALGMRRSMDVWPLLGYDPSDALGEGVGDLEILAALNLMGRNYHYVIPRKVVIAHWLVDEADMLERRLIPTVKQIQIKLASMEKGCAIVGVPSLNGDLSGHFVFVYRGNVYDPSRLKEYNCSAYALPAISAIYIQEKHREPL